MVLPIISYVDILYPGIQGHPYHFGTTGYDGGSWCDRCTGARGVTGVPGVAGVVSVAEVAGMTDVAGVTDVPDAAVVSRSLVVTLPPRPEPETGCVSLM